MENANQTIQKDYSTLSHYCPWQDDRPQPISRDQWPAEEGLQWGSDPSFCYHGFSSPIGTWTEERLVQNLMRNMAGLCTAMDIDFDVPESIHEPSQKNLSELDGFTLPIFQTSMVPQNGRPSETPSPSSSSSQAQMFSLDDTECTQRASCVKARTQSKQRKRKCVQRPGQNLCHCRSEKKRREIIGDRYKELCHIVPGLERQSYTRKYVLEEAALWIQKLIQDNVALHQQLGELKEQEKLTQLRLFPVEKDEQVGC
ncbi:Helix-loop-helix DNA-binding [Penicillium roqueforti FM164]|uniref:Helix-loop-helix DNA-binding n=1 Tax=Penicillium roqueforti (strain FM164) TaxID=1365484 RepID=W6PYF7_PENRF|nr:Helix-loop-helix DNA-binding [Penicillium roqueforti FM164]